MLIPLGFRPLASQFHSFIFDFVCSSVFPILLLSILANFKPFIRFQVTFASKPILHCCLQLIQRNAISRLQNPVFNRESVIKDRIVGEIPHGKVVNLSDRAGMARAVGVDSIHRQSPREHGFNGNQ